MANILYGVSGEGSGHSSRSKEIISYLQKKHNVRVITYGKAYDYLSRYFNATRIYGLHLSYKDNKVEYVETIKDNIINLFNSFSKFEDLRKLIKGFKPDIIFTDFEPTSYYISQLYKIPLVSVDNQHRITNLDIKVPKRYKNDFNICKLIINAIIPQADYYLITSFFKEKINRKNTFIFDPILRSEVFKPRASRKDHILVYQTSESNKALFKELKKVKQKFIVYGFDKAKKEGNILFKKFSVKGFLDDLASCKAVITNGGFTLITEALYFGKPVLSQPVQGQFEQIVNAYYLNKLGYGMHIDELDKKDIELFLNNLKVYERNLRKYKAKNNKRIFRKIEGILKKI